MGTIYEQNATEWNPVWWSFPVMSPLRDQTGRQLLFCF